MRTLLVLLALTAAAPVPAQRPRVSPHETHDFVVAGSKITIDYGRPSKRGREIWGALVPWKRWWMPGADEATIITTDAPLVFAGTLTMPAGKHTLYMWPDQDAPQLIINNQVGQFHTVYNARQDLGRVALTLTKTPSTVEQLTFNVEPGAAGGTLQLQWDDRIYGVDFVVKSR